MVITRSRSATPVKSIAASFRPSSKPTIATAAITANGKAAAGKRGLKRSATDAAIPAPPAKAARPSTFDRTSISSRTVKRSDSAPELKVKSATDKAAKTTATKIAKAKTPEEPFVIPADASEQDCLTRTTVSFPALPFDLEDARRHLCAADSRFVRLFEQVPVRCYEEALEGAGHAKELNLFKTVTTSILGQQISWLAARSVLYKFCRHFYTDQMPEKPDFVGFPREQWPFPTPLMVLRTSDADLRAAGLSFAKIKYVKDLAARFVDGRLDTRQILELENEEACVTELSKVKGVGRWTSEMILMFAMRKPDILPCGDLGVQKGMLNFFLSGPDGPKISIKKRKPGQEDDEPSETMGDQVPTLAQTEAMPKLEASFQSADPFSFDHLITKEHGLCRSVLQSRSQGNKIKGGQYLSPDEMKALAQTWEPYRSVACMFMWSLVDT